MNPSKHVLHAPVPCRPQPIKSSPLTFPWSLSESADWGHAVAAGAGLQVQPSPTPNLPRFPNLIPTGQHASTRRQGFGPLWHKPKPPAKEPTVLFRLRSVAGHMESQTKPQEKKEIPPPKAEKVSGEGLKEACEGPLDLSDRGRSKSSQTPRGYSPLALQGVERAQNSPDKDVKTTPSAHGRVSSPDCVILPSSSSTPPVRQDKESTSDHNHKVILGLSATKLKRQQHGGYGKEGANRIHGLMVGVVTAGDQRAGAERRGEWKDRPKQWEEGACPHYIFTSR